MADENQAFRPLSPDQERLAHAFFTEVLMPFGRRLGDPPEMTVCVDVMVHPMLDYLAHTLVHQMLEDEIEDMETALALAQRWAEVLPPIFLSYVRQRAEAELE